MGLFRFFVVFACVEFKYIVSLRDYVGLCTTIFMNSHLLVCQLQNKRVDFHPRPHVHPLVLFERFDSLHVLHSILVPRLLSVRLFSYTQPCLVLLRLYYFLVTGLVVTLFPRPVGFADVPCAREVLWP